MREYYKIVGHDDLRRDAESMGIVNVDNNALNKFREERKLRRTLKKMALENAEITELKKDMSEMKEMLALILSKMGN